MAPEQARGDAKATPAGDVFALGAVLYFLLTGHAPFHGRDSYEAMRHAGRCDFDRTALSRRGIPSRLAAICLRAMAAEPGERYASAEDFAADLERYLRPPWALIALAGTAALVVLLFAGWYFWPQPVAVAPAMPAPPAEQLLVTNITHMVAGKPHPFTPKDGAKLALRTPLRPGDLILLTWKIPHGFRPALFLVDATGSMRDLGPPAVAPDDPFDRCQYPADREWQIEGPAGTVLFLVCANRANRPTLDDVQPLLQAEGGKVAQLPALQEEFAFLFGRAEVHEYYVEDPRDPKATPRSELRERLKRLRTAAAERFDYVWGAAVPVR